MGVSQQLAWNQATSMRFMVIISSVLLACVSSNPLDAGYGIPAAPLLFSQPPLPNVIPQPVFSHAPNVIPQPFFSPAPNVIPHTFSSPAVEPQFSLPKFFHTLCIHFCLFPYSFIPSCPCRSSLSSTVNTLSTCPFLSTNCPTSSSCSFNTIKPIPCTR